MDAGPSLPRQPKPSHYLCKVWQPSCCLTGKPRPSSPSRGSNRDQGLLLVPDVGAPSGHSVQSVLIPTPLRKKTHLSLSYGCISKGANHALKAEVAAVQQRLRPVSVYGMSFFCNCKCASRYSGMEPRSAPPPLQSCILAGSISSHVSR